MEVDKAIEVVEQFQICVADAIHSAADMVGGPMTSPPIWELPSPFCIAVLIGGELCSFTPPLAEPDLVEQDQAAD